MERRKFTPQFKAKVVLELLSGAKTLAQACREHGIRDSLLYKWRREFLERAPRVFEEKDGAVQEYEARIAELERMVGKLTLELEATKKRGGSSAHPEAETGDRPHADRKRLPGERSLPGGGDSSQ